MVGGLNSLLKNTSSTVNRIIRSYTLVRQLSKQYVILQFMSEEKLI